VKKYYKIWFVLIVLTILCISQIFPDKLQAQEQAVQKNAATVSLKQKFSVDPHITFGELENGFQRIPVK